MFPVVCTIYSYLRRILLTLTFLPSSSPSPPPIPYLFSLREICYAENKFFNISIVIVMRHAYGSLFVGYIFKMFFTMTIWLMTGLIFFFSCKMSTRCFQSVQRVREREGEILLLAFCSKNYFYLFKRQRFRPAKYRNIKFITFFF